MSNPDRKSAEDSSEHAKEQLAENAGRYDKTVGEEAVEDYIDGEESYTRDPDSVSDG